MVAGHGDDPQTDAAAGGTIERFVDVLVIGEVVLAMLEFLGGVDLAKHRLGNALGDLGGVYHRVFDVNGYILLLIRQESVGVPVAGDIVLGLEPLQGFGNRGAESNLVSADIVHHQGGDVIDVGLDVIDIAHQVEQFQDGHILGLNAVMVVRSILASVNHPADGTLQEGMYGIVEKIER